MKPFDYLLMLVIGLCAGGVVYAIHGTAIAIHKALPPNVETVTPAALRSCKCNQPEITSTP